MQKHRTRPVTLHGYIPTKTLACFVTLLFLLRKRDVMITDCNTFHLQDILVILIFSLASFDRIPTFLPQK